MIVRNVRDFVLSACQEETNAFGSAFFEQHLLLVRDYALRLAATLAADIEIVELAAYLHDLAAIRDFSTLSDHAAKGAAIARSLLAELKFPAARIHRIERCIAIHCSPLSFGAAPIEEVCLSNADAMAQIANPVYWLHYAFGVRQFDFDRGLRWFSERIESHWERLIEPAKDMIEEEYWLATRLCGSANVVAAVC